MYIEKFKNINEYVAVGAYEQPDRSLFYRKALALRRFYENCSLYPYNGKPLYPSSVHSDDLRIYPSYLNGIESAGFKFSDDEKDLLEKFNEDFGKFHSSVQFPHVVTGNMWTHSLPNYERILQEGFNGYEQRVKAMKDDELREGLLHLIAGIRAYVNRCVDYLKSVNADEKLINALQKVPFNPAETVYEAFVCWNLVLYLDGCDDLGCIASGIEPYYHGENIVPYLENLYDNLNENNGYTMALHCENTEITLQCLEASKGKRRPMIELFVDENTPEAIWEKAFEVVKTNNGQPAFYNPQLLLGGLQKRFPQITDEEIKKFCGGGCTESMISGCSNVGSVDAGINLLYIFEQCLYRDLEKATSFKQFYEQFVNEVFSVEKTVTQQIYQSQKDRAKFNPLPMRTLLIDDCIEREVDFNAGGARYKWSIVSFAGMINVIDGLLVVRDLVFNNATISPTDLLEKLKNNDKAFLSMAKKHPVCFGVDNEEVNALCYDFTSRIYAKLQEFKPYLGGEFLPSSIQFNCQVEHGAYIGATPDGRDKGAPLCDSLGAIFGKDVKGPTALLKSVTSLDLKNALGVPVFNFNVSQNFDESTLKALILGYMQLGGIQMQITCADAETLQKAYENPEDYRNLVVRVGGYSDYFCNLSDELKKMIIQRTIQKQLS